MADKNHKHPKNAKGSFFCTAEGAPADECITCGLCYGSAPEIFAEDEDGYAYVHTQPDALLYDLAQEALSDCPSNSIGVD